MPADGGRETSATHGDDDVAAAAAAAASLGSVSAVHEGAAAALAAASNGTAVAEEEGWTMLAPQWVDDPLSPCRVSS
jgi:hypothetical protein